MSDRIQKVCVYCASSRQADDAFYEDARRLGRLLAERGITIVYGGGAVGSMGALADGALAADGRIIGVIPRFMRDLEWGHEGITELRVVEDMHERKQQMIDGIDAAIALPGGCGTLEELLEAITWKRLGLYWKPIVLVNTRRFFDPLVTLLQNAVRERMMDERHAAMWTLVDSADDVIPAIESAPAWSSEARSFATL